MMAKWMAKGYLWLLLALLYSPILIIMIFSFTEAKVPLHSSTCCY